MSYILVEWVGEDPRQFSVCKKTDIVDGVLRELDAELEGKSTMIQWKRKEYKGKILKSGTEAAMEILADDLATAELMKETPTKEVSIGRVIHNKTKTKRNLVSAITQVLDNIPPAPQPSQVIQVADGGADEENGQSGNDEDYYKDKYKTLKRKYRDLKSRYKRLNNEVNKDQLVELVPDSGVQIKKCDLEKMKLVSNQVTVFARNLFRYFFSTEELASHSLYGKKCNANKTDNPTLPSIDAVRRDAIIGFLLKESGLDGPDCAANKELTIKRKGVKREITKTLSDFLREENRKTKPN